MKFKFIIVLVLISNLAYSFKVHIHGQITKSVLTEEPFNFDDKSSSIVEGNNMFVDIHEPEIFAAHGDNNQLSSTSSWLRNKRDEVIGYLEACDRTNALVSLGEAFHPVQDLFSHTNAVDNNHLSDLVGINILDLDDGTAYCNNTSEDGPLYAPDGLVSGYFNLEAYTATLWPGGVTPDEASCFGVAGKFLSIEEEFGAGKCCHLYLNKDNGGQINPNTGIAQFYAEEGTNNYMHIIFNEIDDQFSETEAAYYKNMLKKQQRKTIFVIDTTGSMEDDHNRIKNSFNSYVNTILNNGEAPAFGLVTFKDEDAITHHDLVCDISDFKQSLNDIVAYGGDDCPEASGKAMYDALYLNFPSGSPELGFRRGGEIFLYTDAPPSEESLAALSLTYLDAQSRSVSIHTVLTQGCSVVTGKNNITYTDAKNQSNKKRKNPAGFKSPNRIMTAKEFYQELSDKTGGISFQVRKDEIEPIMSLSMFMSEPTTELFYSQKIPVNSTTLTETLIKIDSSMSTGKTMIMVKTIDTAALPTITLTRPNGGIVLESDADITVNNLSTMVTYTIDSPTQGEWKVSLSNGTSSYLVRTYAQTDFGIAGLSLLKEAPLNIRNVQFMSIEGNPIAGDELLLRLSLTQAPDTLTLKLLSENQSIIAEPVLTLVENSTKSYEATIVVPNENFNIKLEGMLNTSQFQREIPLSLKPSKVKLSFDERLGFLSYELYGVQAQNKTFNIHIANKNNTATTYTLSVNSQQGHTVSIQEQVTIPSGQELTVPVSVLISADAIVGSTDEIMIIAQDINNANNSNYKVARLIIRPETLFSNSFE